MHNRIHLFLRPIQKDRLRKSGYRRPMSNDVEGQTTTVGVQELCTSDRHSTQSGNGTCWRPHMWALEMHTLLKDHAISIFTEPIDLS